uniref:Small ribosomal subunit protein uS3m n=1 Tax=Cladonia peziziformis TaxID=184108 RepID=A0A345D2X4_9LECA|nr:ribosomal protein S3 [Cladonia peziziformis]AXF80688.1 ribosomal protein S3 [Cladonia peziziformis]
MVSKNTRPLLNNKLQYSTDACKKLDQEASKKHKLLKRLAPAEPQTEMKANNYIGKPRHFSPLSDEWYNSIYTFNMNLPKILPSLNKILLRIVKSYFNFYSRKLEKSIKSRRLRIKARRLSINKILTSKPQLKHTNDQVTVTIYTYNRQKIYYLNKLNKIASLTIKDKGFDILLSASEIEQQKRNISRNMNAIAHAKAADGFAHIHNAETSYGKCIYNEKFYSIYKNYAAKSLREEILSTYIRQLIQFNKSKFDQRFILPLVDLVQKIYNKNIQFNLVDLKYIYLNSYIFSETLMTKLKNRKNNIIKVLDKSLWLFTVPDMDKLAVYNDIYTREKKLQNLKANSVFKNIKNVDVTGIRIEAAGRLTKRNTAAKSVFKLRYTGNIKDMDSSYKGLSSVTLRGFAKSNLQHTKSESYIRIGSYGIKVWISSFLPRHLYLLFISIYLF